VPSVLAASRGPGLHPRVATFVDRMISPLCGFDKTFAFALRDGLMPKLTVVIPQFAAVHRLIQLERPLAYHIGGYGIFTEEALLRALGETVERYSHVLMPLCLKDQMEFASYDQMAERGGSLFGPKDINPFTDAQLSADAFPFKRFGGSDPVTWVRGFSPIDGSDVWVPAQATLVGYLPRHQDGEPWITAAVTTGSAAHTDGRKALRSALCELAEVDTSMGYWYTGRRAPQIGHDRRTRHVAEIVAGSTPAHGVVSTFHYLANPDLPTQVVACVVRSPGGEIPACGIGVGSDLDLERAMYRAWLEASAITHLAMVAFLQADALDNIPSDDMGAFGDLDQNVGFYALPENTHIIDQRFPVSDTVAASDLPDFAGRTLDDEVSTLLAGFADTHKRLALFDFTTPDIADLGFVVSRCYSPDTLALCLPSYPHLGHPRFKAYGTPGYGVPHPYP
jgi:thiazole/oxazole-forming peptide maturase SagD family component